jgi:acyl carrier protein
MAITEHDLELSWMGVAPPGSNIARFSDSLESLDAVETVMALEAELGWELPDKLLGHPAETTYLDLVQHEADRRAKKRLW